MESSSTNSQVWSSPEYQPKSRFFKSKDGVQLHYLDWPAKPDAPVVAMIHGRLAHAHWFDPVVPYFSPDYHCVSLDLRGHGDSGTTRPITVEQMSSDIAEFVGQFPNKKIILVGHSYGGALTALVQPHHLVEPDLFVMADTLIHWDPSQHRGRRPQGQKLYSSREEIIGRFRLIPGGSKAPPAMLRYIAERSIRQLEDGSWTWKFDEAAVSMPPDGKLLRGEDIELEGISCPTLLIYGEHTMVATQGEAQRVSARIPNATCHMMPDAHHHVTMDDPAEFHRALVEFFGKHGL